jgi:hypothetical protein
VGGPEANTRGIAGEEMKFRLVLKMVDLSRCPLGSEFKAYIDDPTFYRTIVIGKPSEPNG